MSEVLRINRIERIRDWRQMLSKALKNLFSTGLRRYCQAWKSAFVSHQQIDQTNLIAYILQVLFRSKEKIFQTGSFKVPVNHYDAQPLQIKPVCHICQGHRAPCAPLVRIKSVYHKFPLKVQKIVFELITPHYN